MAHPTTEVEKFRNLVTQFVDDMREVDAIHTARDANKIALAKLLEQA